MINQTTERRKTVIDRMMEREIRTDSQEKGKRAVIPAECVMRIHIQSCLNAQSFKGLSQNNQEGQKVHQKKFSSCA